MKLAGWGSGHDNIQLLTIISARLPSQEVNDNLWLTSGAHSLLGRQGHGCMETAHLTLFLPGIETMISWLS